MLSLWKRFVVTSIRSEIKSRAGQKPCKMNPLEGLESTLHSCQDKLLDIFGHLTHLFVMAEGAKASKNTIDPHDLSG